MDRFYKSFLETFCEKMKAECLNFDDQKKMIEILKSTKTGFVTVTGDFRLNHHRFLNSCDVSCEAGLKNTYCQYTGEISASGAQMDEFVDLIFRACYEKYQFTILSICGMIK